MERIDKLEDRVNELNQRIEKIDHTLDKLVEMLAAKQGATPPPAAAVAPGEPIPKPPAPVPAAPAPMAAAPVAAPKSSNMKPGAVLNVWLKPDNYQGGVPTDTSLVTMLDNKAALFNMGRFMDEPEMAKSAGSPILSVWSGYVNIKKGGTHAFIAEFRKNEKKLGPNQVEWHVQLNFNNQSLVDEVIKLPSGGPLPYTLSRPFTFDLDPGFYSVQVISWLPNHKKAARIDYSPLTFVLRDRAPDTLKPRDLGVDDIFHRE